MPYAETLGIELLAASTDEVRGRAIVGGAPDHGGRVSSTAAC